jgi:TetR/AcrR family fatty acid metabolism transcriptional regulator
MSADGPRASASPQKSLVGTPTPASRPRRAGGTRRSARTRQRILEAATEVFARRGFHGARVADIAETAGIAYGLVYHHFRNKEEILAAIFSDRWSQYVAYIEDLGRSPFTFRERIGKLVHFLIEVWRHDPHLITVMINEISRSYEFLESHDLQRVLVAFDAVERLVVQGQASGEVRADVDPQLAAYAILGVAEMVLTGYVMGTLQRETREAYALDEKRLTTLLLEGICTPAAAS